MANQEDTAAFWDALTVSNKARVGPRTWLTDYGNNGGLLDQARKALDESKSESARWAATVGRSSLRT